MSESERRLCVCIFSCPPIPGHPGSSQRPAKSRADGQSERIRCTCFHTRELGGVGAIHRRGKQQQKKQCAPASSRSYPLSLLPLLLLPCAPSSSSCDWRSEASSYAHRGSGERGATYIHGRIESIGIGRGGRGGAVARTRAPRTPFSRHPDPTDPQPTTPQQPQNTATP